MRKPEKPRGLKKYPYKPDSNKVEAMKKYLAACKAVDKENQPKMTAYNKEVTKWKAYRKSLDTKKSEKAKLKAQMAKFRR